MPKPDFSSDARGRCDGISTLRSLKLFTESTSLCNQSSFSSVQRDAPYLLGRLNPLTTVNLFSITFGVGNVDDMDASVINKNSQDGAGRGCAVWHATREFFRTF